MTFNANRFCERRLSRSGSMHVVTCSGAACYKGHHAEPSLQTCFMRRLKQQCEWSSFSVSPAAAVVMFLVSWPEEEEEEGFYKLRPANKTDHLCQSWQ